MTPHTVRRASNRRPSWGFREGESIAEGRTFLRSLGGGAWAEVSLVYDERLAATAVAKVLRPDRSTKWAALRNLKREASVLDRLSHPSVVRKLDLVLWGRYPHLLMEYVEGPTLTALVRQRGALAVDEVLGFARPIAGALAHLSARGVVHLDVKPNNIVMGNPPHLIDVGRSRRVSNRSGLPPTRTGGSRRWVMSRLLRMRDVGRRRVAGLAYIAPEVVAGGHVQAPIGPPSDVWAFGATLYYAVCGRRPFARPAGTKGHADVAVRCPQLVSDPQPLDANVPAELAGLIRSMLARQPNDRPTAAEVVRALDSQRVAAGGSKLQSVAGNPLGAR